MLLGGIVLCAGAGITWALSVTWLVMVGCVLSLWVHRRRALAIAYHAQRLRRR